MEQITFPEKCHLDIIDMYNSDLDLPLYSTVSQRRTLYSAVSKRRTLQVEYNTTWKRTVLVGTFWIPDWLLRHCHLNSDLEILAFREKLFVFTILVLVYLLVGYFFVYYPLVKCLKEMSLYCNIFTIFTYLYTAVGGLVLLLSVYATVKVNSFQKKGFTPRDDFLVMHIPCYSESRETLAKTIDSCCDEVYNRSRKMLWIVVDGLVLSQGSQKTTGDVLLEDVLGHDVHDLSHLKDNLDYSSSGFSLDYNKNVASVYHGEYRGVKYLVVVKTGTQEEYHSPKPGNRGKRDSQLLVYKFFNHVTTLCYSCPLYYHISSVFRDYIKEDPRLIEFVLVADTDTKVEKTSISYLVDQLVMDTSIAGVCGETTVENGSASFITSTQVFEYWLTHSLLKAFESTFHNVLVLSGCFTVYRLKQKGIIGTFCVLDTRILDDYSANHNKTLHEHNLLTIGEDRYLSTLVLRFLPKMKTRYFSRATCSTMVPETLSVLLDQRRRWTNSLVHCHVNLIRNLPKTNIWSIMKLVGVITIELWLVFFQPLCLPVGTFIAWYSFFRFMGTVYIGILTILFLILPLFLPLLCRKPKMCLWWFPFLLATPIYSVVVPLVSLWKRNNVSWGLTRL